MMKSSDSPTVVLHDGNLDALAAMSAEILRRGGVVLVPTETVYGLVCRYRDTNAEERIYQLKQREKSKRLAVFAGDWRQLARFGVRLDGLPEQLAEKYCPGAITIIAPCANAADCRASSVPGCVLPVLDSPSSKTFDTPVSAALNKSNQASDLQQSCSKVSVDTTLGFRVPDHPFILALLKLVDFPLSSTSANASGEPNALTVAEALEQLSGTVELAVDGGAIAPGALASTVVDATGETLRILRQGALKVEIS